MERLLFVRDKVLNVTPVKAYSTCACVALYHATVGVNQHRRSHHAAPKVRLFALVGQFTFWHGMCRQHEVHSGSEWAAIEERKLANRGRMNYNNGYETFAFR